MALLSVALTWLACGSKPLQLTEGCDSQDVLKIENDKLVLTYTFTKPISHSSVKNGGTIIVSTESVEMIEGIIIPLGEYSFKFQSLQPVAELFPEGKGVVRVIIVGSSRFHEWVSDMDGNPVDGDCDGTSGGSFVGEYSLGT
jgi:hypothetical protein